MSPSDKPVRGSGNKSSTQQAVEILRNMILEQQLAPGSNHLESDLARLLGMSRTPIREAALVLEGQGLLEVQPRHGVRILALSRTDLVEIYDVLTELESLSAELAADKAHPDAAYGEAERAISIMDGSLLDEDRQIWAEADDLFHKELVRLGGNQRLARIVEMFSDQAKRARRLAVSMLPTSPQSNGDHRDVLQAIRDGRPDEARELHRSHCRRAKLALLDLVEKHGFHHV